MDKHLDLMLDRAVEVLNRALEVDPITISLMLLRRDPCSPDLLKDETIQVREDIENGKGFTSISPFGLINGLFGKDEEGWGHIIMIVENDMIIEFQKTSEFKKK
jgi:hypothetical protein